MPPKPTRYAVSASALVLLVFLAGCSPVFNWRDVRPARTPVQALFPCKPDQSSRSLTLAGHDVSMTMLGCEAGASSFTLLYADTAVATTASSTLAAWRQITLANVRAQAAPVRPFLLTGDSPRVLAVTVSTHGLRQDGSAMVLQALWFALGSQIFQATVTSDAGNPVVADTFFAGFTTQ